MRLPLLMVLAVFVALSGQSVGVEAAADSLLDYGVLGAMCVLLMGALVFKDRQASTVQNRYVEVVLELTKVVAQNNEALKGVDATRRLPAAKGAAKNIGNLLWRLLVIDRVQLQAAVEAQREDPNAKLGELLVSAGALTQADLDEALELQRGLRSPKAADAVKAADRLAAAAVRRST